MGYDVYPNDVDEDDDNNDEQEYPEGNDDEDDKEDSEECDDNENVQILQFDEEYLSVYGGVTNEPNRGQKRKREEEEEEEAFNVDVEREYEDTQQTRRCSPCINKEEVTEEIAAMPLQSVHHGMQRKACRIETPHNISTQRNPRITRKLYYQLPNFPNLLHRREVLLMRKTYQQNVVRKLLHMDVVVLVVLQPGVHMVHPVVHA